MTNSPIIPVSMIKYGGENHGEKKRHYGTQEQYSLFHIWCVLRFITFKELQFLYRPNMSSCLPCRQPTGHPGFQEEEAGICQTRPRGRKKGSKEGSSSRLLEDGGPKNERRKLTTPRSRARSLKCPVPTRLIRRTKRIWRLRQRFFSFVLCAKIVR